MINVMNCKYGRGLFAIHDISCDTIILKNSFLLIPISEIESGSKIEQYVFVHNKKYHKLVLGDISLVNHSSTEPNVEVTFSGKYAKMFAIKNIKKGDELFLDYGYSFDSEGNIQS